MWRFIAVAMGSVVTLAGFAGVANASATIDLIWADTGTNEITSVGVSDQIQLNVILTAGPNGAFGADVSVDYSEVLVALVVVGYASTPSGPELPGTLGAPYDTGDRIESINSIAFHPDLNLGIGLPAGQSHQLGTVTFHNIALTDGVFEIRSDADGPTNGVGDLFYNLITDTTTFNSAFLDNAFPAATPTAMPGGPTPTPTATVILQPTPTAPPIPTYTPWPGGGGSRGAVGGAALTASAKSRTSTRIKSYSKT